MAKLTVLTSKREGAEVGVHMVKSVLKRKAAVALETLNRSASNNYSIACFIHRSGTFPRMMFYLCSSFGSSSECCVE